VTWNLIVIPPPPCRYASPATIDYFAVAQRFAQYGEGRSWKLIEKLATEMADDVLAHSSAVGDSRGEKIPRPQDGMFRCA